MIDNKISDIDKVISKLVESDYLFYTIELIPLLQNGFNQRGLVSHSSSIFFTPETISEKSPYFIDSEKSKSMYSIGFLYTGNVSTKKIINGKLKTVTVTKYSHNCGVEIYVISDNLFDFILINDFIPGPDNYQLRTNKKIAAKWLSEAISLLT